MKKIITLTLLFFITLFAISCSDNNTNEPTNPTDKKVYKIGVLIPLTGSAEQNGKQSKAAVEYAIGDINMYFALGSIKVKIEAVYKDSGTDSSKAKQMLREFAKDGIKIVIGPTTSTVLKGLKHIADSAGILLISHSSIASELAIKDDNIFRFAPCDKWQAKAIAKIMLADNKKMLIPVYRNDVLGNSLYNEVYDLLESSPLSMQTAITYSPVNANYSAVVQKVKAAIAGLQQNFNDEEIAVYLLSFGEGKDILQYASYHPSLHNIKFYGTSALAFNSALLKSDKAAPVAVSTKFECPIMGLNPKYKNKYAGFMEKIAIKLKHEPDNYALSIYDAVYSSGLTLSLTGDTIPVNRIISKLKEVLRTYVGINGRVELDENGDRINVNYDFMSVKFENKLYKWYVTAVYDTKAKTLTRK